MSKEEISSYLRTLLVAPKVRVLVEGPPLCGKTETINRVLSEIGEKSVYLSAAQLFSDPNVQTMSIFDKFITNEYLIFLDDIETIFPNDDPDFVVLQRFISKKPKVVAACRNLEEIHPFARRYFKDTLIMEQPPSNGKSTGGAQNVTFDDIGGNDKAKETVKMMASWAVENSKKIQEWGLKAPSGAILYGPPGTGKTMLAKAAANACKCKFFSIAIPDLLRCEVGESEKRLTRTFETARADAPSIVFIDEVQALFGKRSESRTDSNRLVVQLLAQLDISSKHGSVICLAATNAIDSVDTALLQPGRFEEIIEVGLPQEKERAEIVRVCAKKIPHDEVIEKNPEEIAKITRGMTASDINGIIQKATINAMMEGREILSINDVKDEIQKQAFKRFKTGEKIVLSE